MSSEPRAFWRLGLAVCGVLALVAGALGGVGLLRGPGLASATIATDRAVTSAGTRLVLQARQPLTDVAAAQVSVTPPAPFTVATRDDAVTVTFSQPLAYATSYRVGVTGVTSRYTGRSAEWSYSFSTPAATAYSLVAHRGDGTQPDDTVVATDGTGTRTVLTAPAIQAYAVTASAVVAASNDATDHTTLVGVDRRDGHALTVQAPHGASLDLLQASADGTRFGYTVTGRDTAGAMHDNALYVQDATDLTRQPTIVTADGKPLAVQDWLFVPGVAAVVVQTADGQAWLVYPDAGTPPVPLGALAQLVGFLPGSTTLVAVTGANQVLVDLSAGKTARATMPPVSVGDAVTGRTTLLGPTEYVVERNQARIVDGKQQVLTQLVHVSNRTESVVAGIASRQGQVLDSGVSANGQLVWAEVLAADAPVDDLTSDATDDATTVVYNLSSGRKVATLPGAHPRWAIG